MFFFRMNFFELVKTIVNLHQNEFFTRSIVFLFSWNDFMVAMNLTAKATQTVPVSIATFSQQYEVRYGEMAAGSLVSLVPALILTFFAQKYIVKGLTAGAVK